MHMRDIGDKNTFFLLTGSLLAINSLPNGWY